jgi:hypothetical protein
MGEFRSNTVFAQNDLNSSDLKTCGDMHSFTIISSAVVQRTDLCDLAPAVPDLAERQGEDARRPARETLPEATDDYIISMPIRSVIWQHFGNNIGNARPMWLQCDQITVAT